MPRKSPTESATQFKVGTKKKGNDGNMWEVKTTKAGVKRWIKVKQTKKPKGKSYLIHDNGGRPFQVIISGKRVYVYRVAKKLSDEEFDKWMDGKKSINFSKQLKYYSELITEFKNVKKIFIGKSVKNEMTKFSGGYGKSFDGNSILLNLSKNKYVYIGESIYSFETKNDKILEYHSPVGNNDVPYPVAVGEKYVYFLIENCYLPKTEFEDFPKKYRWDDHAYSKLYGSNEFEVEGKTLKQRRKNNLEHKCKKLPKRKTIQKRLW